MPYNRSSSPLMPTTNRIFCSQVRRKKNWKEQFGTVSYYSQLNNTYICVRSSQKVKLPVILFLPQNMHIYFIKTARYYEKIWCLQSFSDAVYCCCLRMESPLKSTSGKGIEQRFAIIMLVVSVLRWVITSPPWGRCLVMGQFLWVHPSAQTFGEKKSTGKGEG